MSSTTGDRRSRGIGAAGTLPLLLAASVAAQETLRVNLAPGGAEANLISFGPVLTADARIVAYTSKASNLVPGDTNGVLDVFVGDLSSGITERVSVDSLGVEGNGDSYNPSISANGRWVAFESHSTNLVPGDTNGYPDVFVHDRSTGVMARVSVDSSGGEAKNGARRPALSGDGRFVAFSCRDGLVPGDTNGLDDVFVHERSTGRIERVSVSSSGAEGDAASISPAISRDARFVAFESLANNLVTDDTNQEWDVFVHDRSNGITERVSVRSSGKQGNSTSWAPSISADGQIVAFHSDATNLVGSDTNGFADVFVRDRAAGITSRVSVDSSGTEGDSVSRTASISADGRFVAFYSSATNLVPGDTNDRLDVFVHDRSIASTERASVDSSGVQGNHDSRECSVSADGRFVAFESQASNLVAGDTNDVYDIFVGQPCCDVDARWTNYGSGFPGTLGVPAFTPQADPVLGTTLSLDLGNSYGNDTLALLLAGYQAASIPTHRGGTLLLIPVLILPLQVRWNGTTIDVGIPGEVQFCGIDVFVQVLEIDPGAAKGVSFTAGLQLVLGY